MAVEEPLGLALEIMRLRAFARMWEDLKRPRREDEEIPRGPMVDWCERIQMLRDADAVADALAHIPKGYGS